MALDTIPKQEGGKLKAVASGTLPSGQPVVVNADGTVSVVSGSTINVTESIPSGSESVFNSTGDTVHISVAFDPNNSGKFVICYRDAEFTSYGTAIVGTVSGTSISFGSEYIFNSGNTHQISVSFDPNNSGKFVICYSDQGGSDYGTAVVGTVSGTSISFGSKYVYNSSDTSRNSASFDPNNAGKFVVCYSDIGNSSYGTAIVGTVSGTSISFGSEVVFNSGSSGDLSASFDPNNAGKFVVCYSDIGNSSYGTAIVGTVSGASISFGSEVVFNSATTDFISASFDPNNAGKFVVCYRDFGNSYYGTAIVGTVSGTSISFGSEVVFNSANTAYTSVSFDSNISNKFVVCYEDRGNSDYGTAVVGTVSGTVISFGSEYLFNSGNTDYVSASCDPNNAGEFVVCYRDNGNSKYGTAILGQIGYTAVNTNLTSENYIGMSGGGAVADGGNATVGIVGSVSDEQSGLTAGQQYYVQTDGTIGETPADPSVLAGTAISATKMLVKT